MEGCLQIGSPFSAQTWNIELESNFRFLINVCPPMPFVYLRESHYCCIIWMAPRWAKLWPRTSLGNKRSLPLWPPTWSSCISHIVIHTATSHPNISLKAPFPTNDHSYTNASKLTTLNTQYPNRDEQDFEFFSGPIIWPLPFKHFCRVKMRTHSKLANRDFKPCRRP